MPERPPDEAAPDTEALDEMQPLASEAPLIIYIDFKSPYAYLAIEPTRRMVARLGIVADWRPFVLDIPSYLGSAKLDKRGKKVEKQNRTPEQWSGVKYAYFDCRRYANLSQKTLRGTVKIWNTDGLATGMLWLKRFEGLAAQCAEGSLLARYLDAIYTPFWKREFDAEDLSMILGVLKEIGAPSDGFLTYAAYAEGEGAAINARLQAAAFGAGVYGVPTYILPGEAESDPQHHKFFGRENLPRIEWLLSGRQGPAPSAAYPLGPEIGREALARSAMDPGAAPEVGETPRRLTTFFDFKSPHCYVALPALLALKKEEGGGGGRRGGEEEGIALDWHPFVSRPLKAPAHAAPGEDRSTKHRRIRGEYHVNDLQRYAPHALSDIHRETDCRFADMGLLWLQRELAAGRDVIDDYVERVFVHLWLENGAIDSARAIEPLLLATVGLPADFERARPGEAWAETCAEVWRAYADGPGPAHLDEARAEAQSRSIAAAPTFLLGPEPFQGHAHLPLIRARLASGI